MKDYSKLNILWYDLLCQVVVKRKGKYMLTLVYKEKAETWVIFLTLDAYGKNYFKEEVEAGIIVPLI